MSTAVVPPCSSSSSSADSPPSKKARLLLQQPPTNPTESLPLTSTHSPSQTPSQQSPSQDSSTPMELDNSVNSGPPAPNNGEANSNGVGKKIDEDLYSRQIYVLGKEAMAKMASSAVLISGLGGLGVEIAKNVCLGGVRSMTLHDTKVTSWHDLSSQFYLKKSDIGKNRAEVSLKQLSELNPYTPVDVYTGPLTTEYLKERSFSVVVIADGLGSSEQILTLTDYCHENKIGVILAETRGVFSRLFCDFGEGFVVLDPNGENVKSALIAHVSNDEEALVSCLEDSRHNLETGDYVTFSELEGMEELNGSKPMKVKATGPYSFTIGDTREFSAHRKGGSFTQVKMPVTLDFKPYSASLLEPELLITDWAKMDHPAQLHIGFLALDAFREETGRLPTPYSASDAASIVKIAKDLREKKGEKWGVETVDEKLITVLSWTAYGSLCPMNGFLGGVAAQEVMKACSGKFSPIKQWLYFDAVETLPYFKANEPLPAEFDESDYVPSDCRYDGNIAVFGKKFHERLSNLKYFVVGAGAIGCELLKNFAMMGLSTGPSGHLFVTDMDSIERSNLNRQFLFRPSDVGAPKSSTAARAVTAMNPSLRITPQELRVCGETEGVYDDAFFEGLDGVANALDNVDARIYMDRRCVYYRKPLLESGTLGTKGNTQVVLPYLTESYGSSQDPPEKSIPICTLKNFPHAIEHTIQWARDLFEGIFKQAAENAAEYLRDPGFMSRTLKLPGSQPIEVLESVKKCLVDERPASFRDCVSWARLFFEENFRNQIEQLVFNFPRDQLVASGQLFWSGYKRCPDAMIFSKEDPLCVEFVYTAANLRAEMYGIEQVRDRKAVADLAAAVEVPVFVPRAGLRIAVTDAEAQAQVQHHPDNNDELIENLRKAIPSPSSLGPLRITPLEFEKDDDNNLHIDFIAAASNSRATNYHIAPADRLQTKLIAGKIIPAIATTTSVVAGLVCLELYKIAQGFAEMDRYKNGFVNLALPFFGFSEPIPAPKRKYYDIEWTLWDRFEVEGEMTLKEFVDYFEKEHKLKITMLSQGVCMLFSFFMQKDKLAERINRPLVEVVKTVSRQRQLEPHVRALVFEICCNDLEGADAEVPYIRYLIPPSQLPQINN